MLIATLAAATEPHTTSAWKPGPSLPDEIGFAGMIAGVSHGCLLAGGGANFLNAPPWEGGAKSWHDRVFVLPPESTKWVEAGDRLPRPIGYSVFGTWRNQVVYAGGEVPHEAGHGSRYVAEGWALEWRDGRLLRTPLPPLPHPLANACGGVSGDQLWVIGGVADPASTTALNTVYRLDLALPADQRRWKELPLCPGPGRLLPVAAFAGDRIFVFGGAALSEDSEGRPQRTYLSDAHVFEPETGWRSLPHMPAACVAAASPAPVIGAAIHICSGDDGSQVHLPLADRSGFSKQRWIFRLNDEQWTSGSPVEAPRAVLPAVFWEGRWWLINGEQRPGVRSPEVWTLSE